MISEFAAVAKASEIPNTVEAAKVSEVGKINESGVGKILEPNIELAKHKSLEAIIQTNLERDNIIADAPEVKAQSLTEITNVLRERIKAESRYSDEMIDCFRSFEEYEIYRNAGLHEAEINGRKCLLRDINMDYIDEKSGLTNSERMERGLSPIDEKTGEKVELHHMGQSFDSPFAELLENSEHGGENNSVLHDKNVESFRRNPELKNQYQNHDRPNHWKARAAEGGM